MLDRPYEGKYYLGFLACWTFWCVAWEFFHKGNNVSSIFACQVVLVFALSFLAYRYSYRVMAVWSAFTVFVNYTNQLGFWFYAPTVIAFVICCWPIRRARYSVSIEAKLYPSMSGYVQQMCIVSEDDLKRLRKQGTNLEDIHKDKRPVSVFYNPKKGKWFRIITLAGFPTESEFILSKPK